MDDALVGLHCSLVFPWSYWSRYWSPSPSPWEDKSMRAISTLLPALVLFACQTFGQTTAAESETERTWSFSASLYTYFVPDDREYVQPTITADRDWLHLEARYNYEEIDAASAWVGYNSSFGNDDGLTLDLTPMLGAVFGGLHGVAPGYELTLGYQRFELYSEAEYVI